MGRKYYSPEEFIRDHLARGFTAEQIISRAQKKDKDFIKIIRETLNHTTLIEKLENQVENHQQTQLNFESGNYSSKTLKDKLLIKKPKHNGRSNLPLHTDIQLDDLEAPFKDFATVDKKVSFKNKLGKKGFSEEENTLSLFDEIDPSSNFEKKIPKNYFSDTKTEAFPNNNLNSTTNETKEKEHKINEEQEFPLQVQNNDVAVIQKELNKKNILLNELNKNIGLKEAQIHSIRAVSEDKKLKLVKEIKKLKRKCFAYKLGFSSVCLVFVLSIGISRLKSIQEQPIQPPIQNQFSMSNSAKPETKTNHGSETLELTLDNNTIQDSHIADTTPGNHTISEEIYTPLNNLDNPPQTQTSQTHIVKAGDSWWKITKKYWGTENAYKYKKILKYNNLANESLKKGQVLKIPNLAELD